MAQPPPNRQSSIKAPPKPCIYQYECKCGQIIQHQNDLKDHYFQCLPMKQHYGELFQVVVKYNNKGLSVRERMSLNAVIDMLSNEIQNNCNKELEKSNMQSMMNQSRQMPPNPQAQFPPGGNIQQSIYSQPPAPQIGQPHQIPPQVPNGGLQMPPNGNLHQQPHHMANQMGYPNLSGSGGPQQQQQPLQQQPPPVQQVLQNSPQRLVMPPAQMGLQKPPQGSGLQMPPQPVRNNFLNDSDDVEMHQPKPPKPNSMNMGGMNLGGQKQMKQYDEDFEEAKKLGGAPDFDYNAYMQSLNEQDEYSKCVICNAKITDQEVSQGQQVMLQSTECFHMIHLECFKQMCMTEVNRGAQVIKCPKKGCGKQIQEFELKEILGADYKELEEAIENQLIAANDKLVKCSCGNVMEVVEGKVDLNQKDDNGKPITKEAAVCMSKYRIRCSNCNKNFCSNPQCGSEPYHQGKTCEQHRDFREAKKCRYCLTKLTQPSLSMEPAFKEVCRSQACVEQMGKSCNKVLACGHFCCGFKGEQNCLPCLDDNCVAKDESKTLGKKGSDYCSFCYTEGLSQSPCVQLKCGHIFHIDCILPRIKNKQPGPRIVFNFLNCTECQQPIEAPHCPVLHHELTEVRKIQEEVQKKALERAKFEGLDKDARLNMQGDKFFHDLQGFAMFKLAYYQCFKCKTAYFGGMKDCIRAQEEGQQYKPEELVCSKCSAPAVGAGVQNCPTHGTDYIEFKCRFCCSIAQWFCWGTTHFCEPCHKRQVDGDYVSKKAKSELPKCGGPQTCPLKVKHPENGDEFSLGCAVCRNQAANQRDF